MKTVEDLLEHVAPCPVSGCWIWLGYTKMISNYEQPWAGFRNKSQAVARISHTLCKGEIPEGAHVLHTCHNSLCVAPHHLYLGNHTQNMKDTATSGRRGIGFDGLRKAHEMRNSGMNNQEIASHFGVHHKSISRALNGGRFRYFAGKVG